MIWPFKKRKPAPKAPEIKVAGIFRSADRLSLGKTYRQENMGREFLVAMESGKDAVFRYVDWDRAGTCDWDWHILRAVRYATAEDAALPRYV